jgi:hypothetical protein
MADKKLKPIMLSDVKRIVLNDGDTVVLYAKEHITIEQYESLKETWGPILKEHNVKVVLLDNGMDIGVLGK